MQDQDVMAYVQAASVALALPLDENRQRAVAQHLVRTVAMAQMLDSMPLAAEDEPVALFCPAPFPSGDAP